MRRIQFEAGAGESITWEGGLWHAVTGKDVPGGTLVRFGRDPMGRWAVTGVMVGADHSPVTRRGLRSVPLGDILDAWVRLRVEESRLLGAPSGQAEAWADALFPGDRLAHRIGGGAAAPSGTEVAAFAQAYLDAVADPAGGAPVPRAARAVGIDRSTGYRWLKQIRQALQTEEDGR